MPSKSEKYLWKILKYSITQATSALNNKWKFKLLKKEIKLCLLVIFKGTSSQFEQSPRWFLKRWNFVYTCTNESGSNIKTFLIHYIWNNIYKS